MKFNAGATYFSQEGMVKNSGMDKLFAWVNNSYQITKKITTDINLSYIHYEKNNHNSDAYSGVLPVGLRMDSITPAWDHYTNNYGARFMGGIVSVSPALPIDEAKYDIKSADKFIGNFKLKVDDLFVKGLSLNTMFGKELNFDDNSRVLMGYWLALDQKRDESSVYNKRAKLYNWQVSAFLNYTKRMGKSSVNAMIGAEAQEFNYDWMSAQGNDIPYVESLMYLSLARNQEKKSIGGSASLSILASYFARANYSFDNKYILTATMRADGSSKFLGDNKWGYFPSGSAAWNILEEDFMDETNTFDQLKLRAGWGQVGNASSVGNYAYASTMTTGYTAVFGMDQTISDGAKSVQLTNEEIK